MTATTTTTTTTASATVTTTAATTTRTETATATMTATATATGGKCTTAEMARKGHLLSVRPTHKVDKVRILKFEGSTWAESYF